MATLQKVNLGTPPTAVDGDTSRGANTKANSNVDVLNSQATLTSAAATITSAQALTAAHVGKRVNINLAAADTINVPSAATMGLDGVVHLRNTGSSLVTLAVATGSGDTLAVTKLAGGESVVIDSDGLHSIGCLLRGRSNSDNEAVAGNSKAGSLTVGSAGQATISAAGAYSGPSAAYSGNVSVLGALSVNGAITAAGGFSNRPAFAGKTPWDSGNLTPSDYMPKAGGTFSGGVTVSGALVSTGNFSANGTAQAVGYFVGMGGVLYIYDGGSGNVIVRTGGTAKYFSFDAVGNGNALNGSWVNGSDERLKQNIVPMEGALQRILALRGVYYELKASPGTRQVGVIAQEVRAQFPEAVSVMGGEEEYLGVSYGNLVGPLIEAVKELSSKLDAANARIDALASKAA